MFKFLLCGVLILVATLLGNWFSQRLLRRTHFLQSIIEGINRIKTSICFGALNSYRAIAESFPELMIYGKQIDDTQSVSEYWNGLIDSVPKHIGLKEDDIELIKGFGKSLGITDTQGQINNCELYSGLISERLKTSKEAEFSKSRLYKVLGFSVGCALTLLIV